MTGYELAGQYIIGGLILGSLYVLIALGMTLLYGIMDVVNFAHGEVYMLGGFACYYMVQLLGIDYFASLPIVIVLFALFGVVLQLGFLNLVRGSFAGCMVLTIGLSLVIQSLGWIFFGIQDKSLPSVFPGVIRLGNIVISKEQLISAIIGIVLVACLYLLVDKSSIGRSMRAIAQDREAARLFGINESFVALFACVLSCILAAMAGALMAPVYVLNPSIGGVALFKSFIIIVIGGMGSIIGCVIAGFLLGVIESVAGGLIGGELAVAVEFLMLITVLLLKPRGLMGHEQ